MRRTATILLVVAALSGTACSQATTFGPLRVIVPDGWQVTRRGSESLQIARGTAASDTDTTPGTATAVFDLYLKSEHTVDTYREMLAEQDIGVKTEEWTVDGERAVVLSYEGRATAGPQEAVLFPDHRLLIVYRAAFPNDRPAFHSGLPAFRRAVRSITFSGSPDPQALTSGSSSSSSRASSSGSS